MLQDTAINPSMGVRYDLNEPLAHLMYFDNNNLYGKAMLDPLPTRGFKWLSDKEISSLRIENLDGDSDIGDIFEVDLEIPVGLHEIFSNYPLAPKSLKINENILLSF